MLPVTALLPPPSPMDDEPRGVDVLRLPGKGVEANPSLPPGDAGVAPVCRSFVGAIPGVIAMVGVDVA